MDIKFGNKNKINNANFVETTNINLNMDKKHKDGFWKQVFVNIMSNFLWKVLGILASFGALVLLAHLCK